MTNEAFRLMFVANHARVLRYIEGSVYDRGEAEEIAAEVFTVAWQKFDEREPFGLPWLIRTAMYKVRDHQRRQYRKAAMFEALTRSAKRPRSRSPDWRSWRFATLLRSSPAQMPKSFG